MIKHLSSFGLLRFVIFNQQLLSWEPICSSTGEEALGALCTSGRQRAPTFRRAPQPPITRDTSVSTTRHKMVYISFFAGKFVPAQSNRLRILSQ
jgi:hypothetical protein